MPDLILHNGRVCTFDADQPETQAIAIADGKIQAIGTDADIMAKANVRIEK